jgi:hypothetical protein
MRHLDASNYASADGACLRGLKEARRATARRAFKQLATLSLVVLATVAAEIPHRSQKGRNMNTVLQSLSAQASLRRGIGTGSIFGRLPRLLGALALVTMLVLPIAPMEPVFAEDAPAHDWGYVWADNPSALSYTPNLRYQFNSSAFRAGNAANTIVHYAVGRYLVRFPNLNAIGQGGTVLVTAYGGGTESCQVPFFGSENAGALVEVACFDGDGSPVDTRFTLTVTTRPSTTSQSITSQMGYVWADRPLDSTYTPDLRGQFNSTGATNNISRTGPGTYTVRLPGLGAWAGHVQVTAHFGSHRCKVVQWGPEGADQLVRVNCFTSTGSPVDSVFSATYVNDVDILGSGCCGGGPGTGSFYVWASQPNSPSYTPDLRYQFNISGGTNTITRLGVGQYSVNFPFASLDGGNVQVTAYGSGSEYCKVVYWAPGAGVRVNCFNSAGALTDTRFDATFVESYHIG